MFQFFHTLFKSGTRSLKTQLAIYFIPVTILPTIAISFYATRMFQETAVENLTKRSQSERDAIVAEIDTYESNLLEQAKKHSTSWALLSAVRQRDAALIEEALSELNAETKIRVYSTEGKFIARSSGEGSDPQIAYISKEGLKRVKSNGETLDRFFPDSGNGLLTVVRTLIRDKFGVYGILEEEGRYDQKQLSELRVRRGLDVVFLNREYTKVASSLDLNLEEIKESASREFKPRLSPAGSPQVTRFGSSRFATFVYDLPSQMGKIRYWGHIVILLPMSGVDAMTDKLKLNLILTTAFLILSFALLNFLFSNRIVKPIEVLVYAMKRAKSGRVEQIPPIDSAYEIEYMVRAFNDMIKNVSDAKRALEEKIAELKRANIEIKNTQSTLVQSAKMISLGQIVAGVAHELNNPIGFIYSNMHHLQEYVEKLKELVAEYRRMREQLPPELKKHAEKMEKELDIDFILRDMNDLTKSCVDGAKRTKDIVLGLRTFSRMDESTFRPEDLHEGIRSTIKLLAAEFRNRVEIVEEFGSIPPVECTLSQMNQVFMNLLTNAAQAIVGKGTIWIRTRKVEESVVIEFEDSGSGMSAETMDKIFDPFFTTKKVGQGTGLGLSIAYGLIQKHQGTIRVSSELGRGTRFTITLPIHQKVRRAG